MNNNYIIEENKDIKTIPSEVISLQKNIETSRKNKNIKSISNTIKQFDKINPSSVDEELYDSLKEDITDLKKEKKQIEKKSFGGFVYKCRTKKKLTLKELSKASNISSSHLSRLESGDREVPGIPTLIGLSKGLNVPLYMLLEELNVDIGLDENKIRKEMKNYSFDLMDMIENNDMYITTKEGEQIELTLEAKEILKNAVRLIIEMNACQTCEEYPEEICYTRREFNEIMSKAE